MYAMQGKFVPLEVQPIYMNFAGWVGRVAKLFVVRAIFRHTCLPGVLCMSAIRDT